ncbi:MAG: Rpn family recombination-promoting nuclease/putative transposase [Clostridiales bacterium]|jgi:predicted transposase/invertase (TIGR01784 family)|nr:Rpn family recombination-promoting nuclease/putative transposase [Clostridiales bacterium]
MSDVTILSPKSDIIFKLFFSDERNIDLLRDFLKSVINLPEDDYNEITILDPHLLRDRPGDKMGILDVKLTSKSGKIIHLEAQVLPMPHMESRVVYYQSKMITEQLAEGDDYDKIKRTISIVITDYDFIKETSKYRKRFLYCDPDDSVVFTDISEIYALDLTKLPQEFDGSALCDWLKFLAAETEAEFEMVAERNTQIQTAVVRLKELSADEKTRMLYEAREKERRDNRAREKGARLEERTTIAKRLILRGRSIEEIVEDTGLTYAEVEGLRNNC